MCYKSKPIQDMNNVEKHFNLVNYIEAEHTYLILIPSNPREADLDLSSSVSDTQVFFC